MQSDNLLLISKRILNSAGIISSGKVIQLIVLLLAAKEMGLKEFGIFSFALAIAQFSTFIFIPGGQQGVTKIVTKFFTLKRYQELISVIVFLIFIFFFVTLLVILSNQLITIFRSEEIIYLSDLLLLLIPITLWTIMREGILRGFSYVAVSQAPHELISPILVLCILIFNNISDITAFNLAIIWFVSYSFVEIVLIIFFVLPKTKYIRKINLNLTLNFNLKSWFYDLIVIQISNLSKVCILRTDIIATGIILGFSEAGLYSIAQRFAQPITLVARTIFAATGYLVTKFFEENNYVKLYQNLLITTLFAFIIGSIYLLLIFFKGETFLELVSQEYISAFPILLVLCFALFLDSLSSPSSQFLLICGYPQTLIRVNILGLIIYLLIIFFPIVDNLLINIALAVLLSLLLISIFCMLFSYSVIRNLLNKFDVR